MKRFYFIILAALLAAASPVVAQIVTTSPTPLQENSYPVVLTFHADRGNQGLMGLTASTPVYAHIGVVTNKSNGAWKYAPSWLDNSPKYELTYVSPDIWALEIGDIRSYFGITDSEETVEKIAVVFRDATGSREGKTATGGDIFINVLPAGFQMEFTSDAPLILDSESETVNFTVYITENGFIGLYLDASDSTPFASVDNAKELHASYTFPEGKSYEVVAIANNGSETIEHTINICYPGNSTEAPYPGGGTPQLGAVAAENGDVTFCLAAPGKRNVMIVGAWDNYEALSKRVMNYTDINGIRYFWTTVEGLDPDKEYPYYYLVDGSTKVGDPYARLVLDPYNDRWLSDGTYPGLIPYPKEVGGNVMLAVYKGTRDDYDWKVDNFKGPERKDLIIYELLLRDFTGTEGQARGNGTVKSAMEKLDYLQELGVNAIELMPIQEFNGNNSWGYNTNFYFAPDKAYGTPDDYRAFIDECHRRGMAVILDVVFNQSDGLHPWYQMYPAGSNPFYNERAPHAYSVLNDWNQDNLLVRRQWKDMIRYWMEQYRVDGFRFDLVKGLGLNESYGGNASEYNTNKYNASRVEHMKELTDVMFAINPDAYSINENLAGPQEENEMAANGQLNWANINEAAAQFAMGFPSDSNCNRFYAPRDSRTWGSTVSYAESHDEQRLAYKQDKWGVTGVKGNLDMSMRRLGSVAAQMILSPGAHMIWQFGELGNATSTKNSNGSNNTDPKPVYWNYLNVPARHGLYNNYCQLIAIRNQSPELFDQDADFTINCSTSNWNSGRYIYSSTDSKEMICVINPTMEEQTFTGVKFKSTDNSNYKVVSSSYDTQYSYNAAEGTVTLMPGAYVVIATDNVSGIESAVAGPADSAAMAIGGYGNIVVSGNYTTAKVYDLSGRSYPTLEVPAGIYIVNVDGKPFKVLVK